ncbi:hypothetical protein Trydic_g7736 [Trypoxylus dichotomus]
MQFHSYQLTEDKPLKVVLRGMPDDIAEDEISQDLARQGIRVLSCKRMVVEQMRCPIPLVFVQLTKNNQSKEVFRITFAGSTSPWNSPVSIIRTRTTELPRRCGLR